MAGGHKDVVFGFHAVTSAIRLRPHEVYDIWVDKSRVDQRAQLVLETARSRNIPIHHVGRSALDKMAESDRHQGIVANCQISKGLSEHELIPFIENIDGPAFLLVLDGIQDPHNLGACLRSANAAGVDAVIMPKDRAVGLTATVRKVASGAAEVTPIFQVTNLVRCLKSLKDEGLWLIGLAGESDYSLYDSDLKGSIALVMGAEGKGLRRLTRETCDDLVHIPMSGQVESLNVSVATGICLYEVVRQKQIHAESKT